MTAVERDDPAFLEGVFVEDRPADTAAAVLLFQQPQKEKVIAHRQRLSHFLRAHRQLPAAEVIQTDDSQAWNSFCSIAQFLQHELRIEPKKMMQSWRAVCDSTPRPRLKSSSLRSGKLVPRASRPLTNKPKKIEGNNPVAFGSPV